MKYRIFRRKDPRFHSFYIDFSKRRFYKCYRIDGQGELAFKSCVSKYEALRDSIHIPKLYSARQEGDLLIIELEYIPALPILPHPVDGKEISSLFRCSQKQLNSIHSQVEEFKRDLIQSNLGNINFSFGAFHLIYEPKTDRLVFFDFAESGVANIESSFASLQRRLDSRIELCAKDQLSNLDDMVEDKVLETLSLSTTEEDLIDVSSIVQEGEKLIPRLLSLQQHFYQSVHINGKLILGSREDSRLRALDLKIPKDELVNKSAVDLGCNVGEMMCYYLERGASQVTGIELNSNIVEVGRDYLHYMSKVHPIYRNASILQGDARKVDLPEADIYFYLSGCNHYSEEPLHAQIGKKTKIIYLEGHANDTGRTEEVLPWFGIDWKWTFLGKTRHAIGDETKLRPLWKGVRI